jgi:hypothetical protein
MKCVKSIKPKEDNAVYLFMLKKEAEGKPKNAAKIAALNKFLRIYYARVKEVCQYSMDNQDNPVLEVQSAQQTRRQDRVILKIG